MNIPTLSELNALRDECYKIACEHGFHDEKLSERHFLCLVISELMEAVEADRKGRHADLVTFNNHTKRNWSYCFEIYIKDSVEDELADAAIRIFDLAGRNGDTFDDIRFAETIDYFHGLPFTEAMYEIVEDLFYVGYDVALTDLFAFASVLNIDLMEHIRLKMEYNRTRERLHGKRY
jgi:NTP pyrophosphatase (non-canonical NTP hydrolase)